MRYEVFENVIKESLTEKFVDRYYTIVYQDKKYNYFGPLVWREHVEMIGYGEYAQAEKFYDYDKALARCNKLNSKWESEDCVVSNNSYKINKNILRNKFTGVVVEENYTLYWKFLFVWIPWITFDNYESAMLRYARCVNGLSNTYVSSRGMNHG
jgi:hypothetical protein